ncbi:MAG TPA: LysR family transcriptional regulator, partial [Conexibacter sp.]|nr:LysR family transcriptional regulator [Conexibacter sp.]
MEDHAEDGPATVLARPPWLGIELRLLATLAAVASECSFRGAADVLGYVPSAVSQQIARLERLVGARLVERERGVAGVTVTEAGGLLLRHFAEVMSRLDAAQADLEALREGRAGTLVAGVDQSVAGPFVPPLLRMLAWGLPQRAVRVEESYSALELGRRVECGELDLALGELPLTGPFACEVLVEDPYVLLVPKAWAVAASPGPLCADALRELPLIGLDDERGAVVEAGLLARKIEPRFVLRSSLGAVQELAAAGVGAAIVPRLSVNETDVRTIAVALDGVVPPRVIGLYWHRERRRLPAYEAFVELAALVPRRRAGLRLS